MKKKIFGSLIVIAIAAVAAFNVNMNLAQESNMSALALANIEALATPETGAGITTQIDCQNNGGYWNMALVCSSSGVTSQTCEVSGKLVILGFTIIDGSFKQGKTYTVAWENWSCINSTGNCCIASSQGIHILS
ncbi:NVEALA domain-containing protein [Dysgonomonas reticulitermitis]